MKVNHFLILILVAFTLLFNLNACGKYEEGPNISLRTKKSRLVGDWKVVSNDNSMFAPQLSEISFQKNGQMSITSIIDLDSTHKMTGSWEFSNDKIKLIIEMEPGILQWWEILRLTNKELWIQNYHEFDYKLIKSNA